MVGPAVETRRNIAKAKLQKFIAEFHFMGRAAFVFVGLPGIEPGPHAPHAYILPLYDSPIVRLYRMHLKKAT